MRRARIAKAIAARHTLADVAAVITAVLIAVVTRMAEPAMWRWDVVLLAPLGSNYFLPR